MGELFQSRKFWALIIALMVVIVAQFAPGVSGNLDAHADELAGGLVVLSAYIVAVALDPGSGWRGLLQSRKFYAALIGVVLTVLSVFDIALPAGITGNQVEYILYTLSAYIVAVAFERQKLPDNTQNGQE